MILSFDNKNIYDEKIINEYDEKKKNKKNAFYLDILDFLSSDIIKFQKPIIILNKLRSIDMLYLLQHKGFNEISNLSEEKWDYLDNIAINIMEFKSI